MSGSVQPAAEEHDARKAADVLMFSKGEPSGEEVGELAGPNGPEVFLPLEELRSGEGSRSDGFQRSQAGFHQELQLHARAAFAPARERNGRVPPRTIRPPFCARAGNLVFFMFWNPRIDCDF